MKKRMITVAAILLVGAGSFLIATPNGAGRRSPGIKTALIPIPPAGCRFSNYFAYAPSALHACGLNVWPLTRIQQLPGGGQAYIYDEGRYGVVKRFVPPDGFDPAIGSSRQLEEYGVSLRPSSARALIIARAKLHEWKASPPPPYDLSYPGAISGGHFVKTLQP